MVGILTFYSNMYNISSVYIIRRYSLKNKYAQRAYVAYVLYIIIKTKMDAVNKKKSL